MNENIDLTKILENCPEGTIFWSDNYGIVQFKCIIKSYTDPINYPILVKRTDGHNVYYTKEGWSDILFPANCLLWPSKDCRDWSKFIAPWYNNDKNEKFNPETLKPFDRVLIRDEVDGNWKCDLFSYIEKCVYYPYKCVASSHIYCIPYNDDTKYLVGTKEEAPEYYRYWKE